jgi:hypothetical protein
VGTDGGTFTPVGAGVTFPADTVFGEDANTITLGSAGLEIGGNTTTFTIDVGGILVGKVTIDGDSDKSVVLTGATITAADSSGSVVLTKSSADIAMGAGSSIALANEGTIEVAGGGSMTLPNTVFGNGTYTAAGEVTINALAAGDTIVTAGGDNATDGLTIGGTATKQIILRQHTSGGAATFTFKKNDANAISLVENSSMATITVPAVSGSTDGAQLKTNAAGIIEIGKANTAGITLGGSATSAKKGSIYVVQAGKLGVEDGASVTAGGGVTTGNLASTLTWSKENTNDLKALSADAGGVDAAITKDTDLDATG